MLKKYRNTNSFCFIYIYLYYLSICAESYCGMWDILVTACKLLAVACMSSSDQD